MNPSELSPQAKRVLDHLNTAGSVTNVEANAVLKVRSVSRRITEIRDAGYDIKKSFSRDSTGQRYVRYSLLSAAPATVDHHQV